MSSLTDQIPDIIRKVIWYGALLFLIVTIVDTLLWPNKFNFSIDNYLFPFGFLFLSQFLMEKKSFRLVAFSLVVLFLWECIVSFLIYQQYSIDILLYVMRSLKLPVVFSISIALISRSGVRENIDNLLKFIFYSVLFLNLIMIINPFGAGAELHKLYSPKLGAIFGNYHEPGVFRLSGTFMNPNDNAQLFGLFFIFFLSRGLKPNWIEILLSLLIIFLTQSRTAYVALMVLLAFGMLRSVWSFEFRKAILPASFMIGALLLILILQPVNLISLLEGTALSSNSFSTRLNVLYEFSSLNFQQKFVGSGSIIDSITQFGWYYDSDYLFVMIQYGITGFIGLLCFWFYVIKIGWHSRSIEYLVLFVLVTSITNQTVHNPSTSVFIFFVLATFLKTEETNFQKPAIARPVKI